MPQDFLSRLTKEILLFDGAMGTMLQARGLAPGEPSEKWNLDHPEVVKQIHCEYVEAGADILITNSFGGSPYKLQNCGLGNKIYEVNYTAAKLAARAASGKAYVAGSVGPTGKFLQPLGEVAPEEMYDGFVQQIQALRDGGADLICVETMTDSNEAVLAIKAAKEVTTLPVIASMTYEKGKKGYRTIMGHTIEDSVKALLDAGADVVGTNCGNGIEPMIEIVATMRKITQAPLLAEPNAGLPKLIEGRPVYSETPEIMAARLPELIRAGANIVGGCCGTTPEHIRKFREVLTTVK
ncbi:MAG: homocysteine S-methyltransferase family protein [candidate division KSB1 bacterium]|nr:homocysteine S-methyltransferase family protein [candidate division KSB1 bacterium]